jgi:hypothetical protein
LPPGFAKRLVDARKIAVSGQQLAVGQSFWLTANRWPLIAQIT